MNIPVLAVALVTATMGAGYSLAAAQGAKVQPGTNDDLRAAYANAADVAEGKRIAESTCAACHGANGVSRIQGVPNLAGQRPAYLYLELRAYQSGARSDTAMGDAVKPLNDNALVKVAAYYASLDPAQPARRVRSKLPPTPIRSRPAKLPRRACAGCHGETGVSKTPGTPSLVGLDPKYLVAAMKAYKAVSARTK